MRVMTSWDALSIAEQTLMRAAVSGWPLAGTVQRYGVALRWAGATDAPPPRSYRDDEQRALVPYLAAVALDLSERGLLTVYEADPLGQALADSATAGAALPEVLTDPANWLFRPGPTRRFALGAPRPVRDRWFHDAYPVAATDGLPTWDDLTVAQRQVLVCAAEASGMLTGAFGIWQHPEPELDKAQLYEWTDRQLAPLLPFVRDGWIEVRHVPDEGSGAFTVIPLENLHAALVDPAVRYEGDDWGIGLGCVFTTIGGAVWRGAWSSDWAKRLHFD
jgi:hypothetical protein